MDVNNVLTYTHNLDELEADYSRWQMLTYDEKKISDMHCMQKYGIYNMQLYEMLKAQIASETEIPMEEASFFIDDSKGNINDVIRVAYNIQKQDPNITILTPRDSIEQLDTKFDKYMQSPENYKTVSDTYSIELFGNPIITLYNKYRSQRSFIQSGGYDQIKPTLEDYSLIQFENNVKHSADKLDVMRYGKCILECMIGMKRTNYEKVQMQNILDQNPMKSEINFDNFLSQVTPFMSINEYQKYNNTIINPFNYICIEDGEKYIDTIRKLQNEGATDSILKLGWNPSVKITPESIKYARDKQIKYLNEKYNIQFIDLSNYTTDDILDESVNFDNIYDPAIDHIKLHPVFIPMVYNRSLHGEIIKKFTKSSYSHIGISLDSSLDTIYTFNYLNNYEKTSGFGTESLKFWINKDKESLLGVAVIFVDNESYKKLKRNLNWFIDNQSNTKYNFKNLFNIIINKAEDFNNQLSFVCSQFIDVILNMTNIHLIDKSSNLVVPGDFYKLTRNPKVFLLYEGKTKNYSKTDMNKKIRALSRRRLTVQDDPTIIDNVVNAIKSIGECNLDTLSTIVVKTDNDKVNSICREMVNLIQPESILEEYDPNEYSLHTDIYTGDEEDNSIDNNFTYISQSLQKYDSSKSIDTLISDLISLYDLTKRIDKNLNTIDIEDIKYKDLSDMKDRIGKLFNAYHKIVKSRDSSFDFTDYLAKNKPFDNANLSSIYKYDGSYIN